jgi:hypothetical protein
VCKTFKENSGAKGVTRTVRIADICYCDILYFKIHTKNQNCKCTNSTSVYYHADDTVLSVYRAILISQVERVVLRKVCLVGSGGRLVGKQIAWEAIHFPGKLFTFLSSLLVHVLVHVFSNPVYTGLVAVLPVSGTSN